LSGRRRAVVAGFSRHRRLRGFRGLCWGRVHALLGADRLFSGEKSRIRILPHLVCGYLIHVLLVLQLADHHTLVVDYLIWLVLGDRVVTDACSPAFEMGIVLELEFAYDAAWNQVIRTTDIL